MTLNIYENKEVIKTYDMDTYDLMFRTLDDVAGTIKIDQMKTGSEAEIIKIVGSFVVSNMGTVKDLLKDIFPGITEEEIRNTKLAEIISVFIDVVKYTIEQIALLPKSKN